jgi:hypothetical protein
MFQTCVISRFNLVQAYFIINVKASPERGAADLLKNVLAVYSPRFPVAGRLAKCFAT